MNPPPSHLSLSKSQFYTGMDCGGVVEKQGEKRTGGLRTPERCPRCNSSNTKFCYYNNYSHTQPRHFCKTCRRYWTKGGALRNVPVGGGCRKTKKSNTNEANASFSSPKGSFNDMVEAKSGGILNGNIGQLSSDQTLPASNALELHNGFSSWPSIDSHVVGGFPKLQPSSFNRFPSYNDVSSSSLPFNAANSSHGFRGYSTGFMGSQRNSLQSGMASSIESLSAMNANLHLKLQQKRLAMLQTEGSSDHNALDAMGVMVQPQYELDLQNQQQITGLRDPNSLRKNDGICSLSSSQRTVSVVDRGDEARESTHEWNFDENSWPDLQQYSSLP